MKRVIKLIICLAAALSITSCAGSFKDIKLTSCDIVSIDPRGLSAFDAALNLGVHNPAPQVTLSEMKAVIKMDQMPCLHLTAEDLTLARCSDAVYNVSFHGNLDENFNPFMLLQLLNQQDPASLTADISFHGKLRSGLGKYFEYKDIPIKDFLGKK